MNAIALPRLASRSIAAELVERQPMLARYGVAMFACAALTALGLLVDERTLNGVNVWMKPTKFFVSVGVFALTAAWFFGYVRPERRNSRLMRWTVWTLIGSGSFELAWITWQASQGLASHFNTDTSFFAIMYALMGLFAVVLTATTLPLAWEIARRPAPGLAPDFRAAVVIGLILTFILGAGFGGYMSSQAGHAVGPEGNGVALFGWNRIGGDLRVAHFFGIHAEQLIPLLSALMAGAATRVRWAALIGGAALYTAVTVAVFVQAVAGRPLLPI